MQIGKIQNIQSFNGADIDERIKYMPMLKGSIKEINRISKNEDVEIIPTFICIPGSMSGIKVSAYSQKTNPKYAQADIYIPETPQNIKDKAVLSAVKKVVEIVNK